VIAIIDYGVGNIRSIQKAVEFVGGEAVVTSDPAIIEEAEGIILPGVGAFKAAMDELEPFKYLIFNANVPVMGVCLGMQLFATESEEGGLHKGLDVVPGRVVRFPKDAGKIPHMGWNRIKIKKEHPVFEGVKDGSYMYFVHSYYFQTSDQFVLTTTDYGIEFASSVLRDNYIGFQFHPEKSGRDGLRIVKNFVKMCRS
jgi:glutamine amidotransferase